VCKINKFASIYSNRCAKYRPMKSRLTKFMFFNSEGKNYYCTVGIRRCKTIITMWQNKRRKKENNNYYNASSQREIEFYELLNLFPDEMCSQMNVLLVFDSKSYCNCCLVILKHNFRNFCLFFHLFMQFLNYYSHSSRKPRVILGNNKQKSRYYRECGKTSTK